MGGSDVKRHVHAPPAAAVRSTSCWAKRISALQKMPPVETAMIDGDVAFRQQQRRPH